MEQADTELAGWNLGDVDEAGRAAASVRVVTLGSLHVEGKRLTRPKPLLLIAYLAQEGPTDRERLSRLFFSQARDRRDALSTTLARSKGLIDRGNEDDPRVSTRVTTDAQQFLAAALRRDVETALGLYRGAFAQGYDHRLEPELEEWVVTTRERLASLARDLNLLAAHAHADRDDPFAVWRYAQAAVTLTEHHALDPAATFELLCDLVVGSFPVPDDWWRALAGEPAGGSSTRDARAVLDWRGIQARARLPRLSS